MTTPLLWGKKKFSHLFLNRWWHFTLLMLVVCILSLLPSRYFSKIPFSIRDLIVHMLMYGSLAFSASMVYYDQIRSKKNTKFILAIPFALGLFGLLLEYLQKILPIHRYFSWEDAASNFIGACLFYFFIRVIRS